MTPGIWPKAALGAARVRYWPRLHDSVEVSRLLLGKGKVAAAPTTYWGEESTEKACIEVPFLMPNSLLKRTC